MEQAREKLTGPSKEAFTSTYDMIMNEGVEQGIEQGIDKAIEGLLNENMSVELIVRALKVSKDRVLRIKEQLSL